MGRYPTIFESDGSHNTELLVMLQKNDAVIPFWICFFQNDNCIGEIINLGGIKEYTINEA